MALIKWRPFHELEHFFKDFDNQGFDLAADVYQEDDMVVVEMNIPGISPDKIDISVENNHLHIHGSRDEHKEVQDRDYYHKEIRRGEFERIITLPCSVNQEQAKAYVDRGILYIALPKKSAEKGKIRLSSLGQPYLSFI